MKQNTIIYVSSIPWNDIKQRQHHLCQNLAKENKVIYFSFNSVKNLKKYINQPKINSERNLKILEIFVLPFTRFYFVNQINALIAYLFLKIYLKVFNSKFSLILSHPTQSKLIELNYEGLYYDYVDDVSDFDVWKKYSQKIKNIEAKILGKTKAIFASSKLYKEKVSKKYKNVHLIPNGVNINDFKRPINLSIPKDIKDINKPIIAYYGAIGDWLDFDLIEFISNKNPKIQIILIGNIITDINRLKKYKNIHFLGIKNYQELPLYLYNIKTWIIPFKQNDFTKKINPVKVYEYLAANRSIVSTYLPEILPLNKYISIAKTKEEFIKEIKSKLEEDKKKENNINTILKENTWFEISNRISKIINSKK